MISFSHFLSFSTTTHAVLKHMHKTFCQIIFFFNDKMVTEKLHDSSQMQGVNITVFDAVKLSLAISKDLVAEKC